MTTSIFRFTIMQRKTLSTVRLILPFALATLACNIFLAGPDCPAQTIPISSDEVTNMQNQIEQAFLAGAETGVVTLQITESQLTSYFALKMQSLPNPPFTEP